MQNQLSLWLRPYLRRYSKFGEASFTLTQFFRDQAATAPPVAPRAETGPFGGVKKRLRPEESGGEFEVEGGGGGNGRRARPHIEVSFEELAGNAGFTSGGVSGRWGCPFFVTLNSCVMSSVCLAVPSSFGFMPRFPKAPLVQGFASLPCLACCPHRSV